MKWGLTNDVADFRSRNSKKFDVLERLQSFVVIFNIYMLFIYFYLNNVERYVFADVCVSEYFGSCERGGI